MKDLSYFSKLGQLRIQDKFLKILSANILFSIPLFFVFVVLSILIANQLISTVIEFVFLFFFMIFISYYNKNYFLTLSAENKNAILLNNYKNMKMNITDKKAFGSMILNQLKNLSLFIPIVGWIFYYSNCFYPYMILDDTFYLKADFETSKQLTNNYKKSLFLLDIKYLLISTPLLFILISLFVLLKIPFGFLFWGLLPFFILRDAMQTVIFYDSTFKNTSVIVKEQ